METNIQIFTNPEFGQIRTTRDENGEPLFCLTDLCKVLELRAPDVKRRLDDAVVSTHTVKDSLGRKNLLSFVNEDGFYDTVLDSRKPEAKAFRKWVTSEVLPQIRQTGGYIPLDEADNENTILRKALTICERTVEQQNKQLAEQKPKVAFAEMVMASNDLCSVAVLAKMLASNGIKIGQVRLFRWMREHHYLGNCEPHWNVAHQRWIERGLFRLKVSPPWYDWNGNPRYRVTSLITGKGQQYFINLFIRNNI